MIEHLSRKRSNLNGDKSDEKEVKIFDEDKETLELRTMHRKKIEISE